MYTVDDMSRELRISRQTLYRWRKAGVLPAPVLIGGSIRWREQDVAAWLDWLAQRAEVSAGGGDPDAADGPCPPVMSTGEALFDGRVAAAQQAEARRRAASEARRAARAETESTEV